MPLIILAASQAWETKDYLTLSGSLIALVFSTITLVQKLLEQSRGWRKQLTEILEKITDINLESEKSRNNTKGDYPPNYQGLLNDQRRFFVRQAAFLTKKIPKQVSPYEWLIVAWGWVRIDEPEEAEHLFQSGIQSASSLVDRGLSNRSYAFFLADEGRLTEANRYFAEAIGAFEGPGDRLIFYRSTTYERWSLYEQFVNREDAKIKLRMAINEWHKHSNPERLKAEVKRLVKLYQERFPENADTIAIDFSSILV